jgi:hypothetical protein
MLATGTTPVGAATNVESAFATAGVTTRVCPGGVQPAGGTKALLGSPDCTASEVVATAGVGPSMDAFGSGAAGAGGDGGGAGAGGGAGVTAGAGVGTGADSGAAAGGDVGAGAESGVAAGDGRGSGIDPSRPNCAPAGRPGSEPGGVGRMVGCG